MKKKSKIKKWILIIISILLVIISILGISFYFKYRNGLPILGYHNVVSDEEKELYYKHNRYVMGLSDFEKQMKYLYDHDYETLTMDQIYDYYQGNYKLKENSVALTFDDGYESFHTTIKPILEKYDLQATCFVIGKKLEKKNPSAKGQYTFLRKNQIQNDEHVSYYSHTYDLHHKAGWWKKQMEVVSYDDIKKDLLKSEEIGIPIEYFAFPFGRSSRNAQKVIKDLNIKLAFGYNQNHNMIPNEDRYILPRYLMFDFMPMWLFTFIVK